MNKILAAVIATVFSAGAFAQAAKPAAAASAPKADAKPAAAAQEGRSEEVMPQGSPGHGGPKAGRP